MDTQDRTIYFERMFDLWMQGFSAVNPQFDAFAVSQIKRMHNRDVYIGAIRHDSISIVYGRFGVEYYRTALSLALIIEHREDMIVTQGQYDGKRYASIIA